MRNMELRKIPLEERISRMKPREDEDCENSSAWRAYCTGRWMRSIGLKEYQAGVMKLLDDPGLAEALQKLDFLTACKNNYSLSGFLANIWPCDKRSWYVGIFEYVILPFARISQKSREKWMDVSEAREFPFDDLPDDNLPFD